MKKGVSIVLGYIILIVLISCNSQNTPTDQAVIQEKEGVIHPDWSKNANIYEVNIRQYTKGGTFKAFETHLPRLQEMGVDILWLMPVFPIGEKNRKGPLGSYYAVRDYKAINSEMGTMDDFKSFVQKAHDMGFKIILDWVANHTAWDNPWIFDHPEWYTKDSTGQIIYPSDWTDVADLNYDEPGLRDAMTDALKFWVKEANIDGYRCDVAGEVPTDFWVSVRHELDAIKPVFMLAEAEKVQLHDYAFDMTYAWELHNIFNKIAQGKQKPMEIDTYFMKMDTTYPSDAYRMNFITNHDENSWNGTVKERMGEAADVFAVLSYTLPGMPLIYSGQEVGLDKRLRFFEKDLIQWNYESPLIDFYTRLNDLKHKNTCLWNGDFGSAYEKVTTTADDNILAFMRNKDGNKILTIANLSEQNIEFSITQDIGYGDYNNYFSQEEFSIHPDSNIELKAWQYKVLISK